MSDQRIEITLSGDPSGLKKATLEAADAIDRLQKTGEKLTASTTKHTEAADRFIEKMKQEAIQLSAGDLALRKYQISTLGLSDAASKQANALAESIDKLKGQERAAKDAGSAQDSMTGSVLKGTVAADLAVKAFGKIVDVYREMKSATMDAQQNEIKQAALLEMAGEKASGKREVIERLAASMAKLTRFDDDQVRAAGNLLLTYDMTTARFERVIKVAGDMAVVFGGDLASNVEQAARIVSAGADSVGLLTRKFRDLDPAVISNIKSLIEMNEAGRAQDAILAVLEGKVSGLAEKSYVGLERTTRGVSKSWDDLLKAMGSKIFDEKAKEAGYLETRMANITSAINSDLPTWQKAFDVLGSLTFALTPGMDVAGDIAGRTGKPPAAAGAGPVDAGTADAKAALTRAAADYAGLHKALRSTREKLDDEVATLWRVGRQANIDIDTILKDEAAIRAKYASKRVDNSAEKEAERQRKEMLRIEKEITAEHLRDIEAVAKLGDLRAGLSNSWEEETDRLREQVDMLGLTNEQRAKAALLIKRNSDLLAAGNDAAVVRDINQSYEEQLVLLDRRAAKMDDIAANQRVMQSWDELGDKIIDVLTHGMSAVKDFGRQMAAIFLKKYLLQLGADFTGSSSMASAAANAGGGSFAGSMLGSATGSLFTGGGLIASNGLVNGAANVAGNLGFSSVSNFLGGATGAIQGPTLTGAALGGESALAGSTLGSTLGAAIPYVAAALAIYALYKKFAGAGGGPKSGGSYQGIYDASGALTGTDSTHLFGLQPGESTGNPQQLTATQGAAAAYYALVRNLGGKSQGFTFSSGFDTDPQGTAQTRVAGQVKDASGNDIFRQYRDVGRGTDMLPAEMQLTTSRMIVAALKDSKLPVYMKEMIDGVALESATQTQLDDLIKKLSATKAAWDGLTAGLTEARDVIAMLNGDNLPTLKTQMDQLKDAVDAASGAFDAGIASGDPIQIQTAQTSLLNAVLNRYAVEKQAIADITAGLSALKASTYEFNMANAARINKYGGKIDVGAIASGRYTDLQSTINQGGTPEERISNINAFLGAVDAWVGAQQAALASQDQAQQAQQAAIAAAQQAAIQSRIQGLQTELQLAQQWAGVLSTAQQAIDKMRLTTSSPDSIFGRLSSSSGDVDGLLGRYRGASGASRVDLANQLMAAVNTRQGLGQEAYQRPSAEYLAEYNKNIAILYEVKADAKTEAEKQTDLQSRIEQLTVLGNSYAQSASVAANQSSAALDAIYAQARDLAIWAQDKYDLAATEQTNILNDQLAVYTGGLDVTLYTAKVNSEMRDFLESIDAKITAFMTGGALAAGNTGGAAVNGGGSAGGAVVTGGGSAGGEVITETPIIFQIGDTTVDKIVVSSIGRQASTVRRDLARS